MRHPTTRILGYLALSLWIAGCGGGDDTTVPPPPDDTSDAGDAMDDVGEVGDAPIETAPDTGIDVADTEDVADVTDVADAIDAADAIDTGVDALDAADTTVVDAPETAVDSGVDAADTADTLDTTPPADSGCGAAVSTTTAELWVDKAATGPSAGTAPCPFHTIREATTLTWAGSGLRTIHVKGGGTTLANYVETDVVRVKASVKLVGDGPTSTKVSGGSATSVCSGPPLSPTAPCLVYVEAGGTLDGFLVQFTASTTNGDGIVLGDESGAPPVVKNVTATGAPRQGIFSLGAADLGPNLHLDKNGQSGLSSTGLGYNSVRIFGTTNSFDGNSWGIGAIGGAHVTFEGGTANGNSVHGLALSGPTGTFSHSFTGLVARDNGYAGIAVSSQASLVLRNSVLLHNADGLTFHYGSSNKLDIGTSTSSGNNVFNATGTDRNSRSGVCLSAAPGTGAQPAIGNKWAACPVVQTGVSACGSGTGTYDAAYAPTTAGPNPLVTTGCAVGP